jgi:hypothetical protein
MPSLPFLSLSPCSLFNQACRAVSPAHGPHHESNNRELSMLLPLTNGTDPCFPLGGHSRSSSASEPLHRLILLCGVPSSLS